MLPWPTLAARVSLGLRTCLPIVGKGKPPFGELSEGVYPRGVVAGCPAGVTGCDPGGPGNEYGRSDVL